MNFVAYEVEMKISYMRPKNISFRSAIKDLFTNKTRG